MAKYALNVNGAQRHIDAEADAPLLYVLRNDLELNGPKFGCGLAQCGACSVLLDGREVRSCVTPVSAHASEQKRRAAPLAQWRHILLTIYLLTVAGAFAAGRWRARYIPE